MVKTFMCYLHKPGHVTPELRVIACDGEGDLRATITSERPTWGPYDMIEVYDDNDHPIFRLTNTGRLSLAIVFGRSVLLTTNPSVG